jgi:hypothetical protein
MASKTMSRSRLRAPCTVDVILKVIVESGASQPELEREPSESIERELEALYEAADDAALECTPPSREGVAKYRKCVIDDGFEKMSADAIKKYWPKCCKCDKRDVLTMLRMRRLPATDDDNFKNWGFCLVCTAAVMLDVACGMGEFEEYSGISNVPVWFLGCPSANAFADLIDEGYIKDIEPEIIAAIRSQL